MKSISRILLGLALAAFLGFAGCGGEEGGSSGGGDAAPASGEGDKGSGEKDGAMKDSGTAEMVAVSLELPKMT